MKNENARPLVKPQRKVDIYFRKGGRIDITSRVVKALSIQDGDVINVLSADNEYFLYVERRAADIRNGMARYRHAARRTKSNDNMLRCQSIALTDAVNAITEADESWLFVGTPRSLSKYGVNTDGVPLIVHNNQYNK